MMNTPITMTGYSAAAVGSLLPDIDTPASAIGRLFAPLSVYIERRFGHRTITHSLIGWLIFSFIGLPLLILRAPQVYLCFVLGIFSHILLDAVNKSGVPLFYPNLIRAVIPKNEKLRILTASKQEFVFLAILSCLSLPVIGLNRIGIRPALHYLVRTPQSAVSDYLNYSSQGYEVLAEFEGIFNISQKRITARWPIISSRSKNSLILLSPDKKLYSAGSEPHDNIRPLSIQSFKAKPIKRLSREIRLIQQPLSDILKIIPRAGRTYILGYAKTFDDFDLDFSLDEYQTINRQTNRIEFDYATYEDIIRQNLTNILAVEARILLMTFYHADEDIIAHSTFDSGAKHICSDVITLYIKDILNPEKELMFDEGELISKGDLLASCVQKRKLLLIEKEKLENKLAIVKSNLDKLRIQIEEERCLKEIEDKLTDNQRPLTLNKRLNEIKLKEAEARVKLAFSDLEKIQKRIKETKVYSRISGKILSIKMQASTAIVRILKTED